jgi:hypothetical protein
MILCDEESITGKEKHEKPDVHTEVNQHALKTEGQSSPPPFGDFSDLSKCSSKTTGHCSFRPKAQTSNQINSISNMRVW